MKSTKFFKTHADDAIPMEQSFELILDPVRSKIFFEIILNGEVNVEQIIEATEKSRSTISHHLKKLVESGLLDVYMHPTGKTKYYRITQNIQRFMYSLDEDKLAKGTIEEKSAYFIEMYKMFSLMSHIFANIQTDQVKLLQEHQPFDKADLDEDGDLIVKINKKEITEPYLTFNITGEKQANFVRKGLRILMKDFEKEFGQVPDSIEAFKKGPKHIINLQIMPFVHKSELKK
ncbi:MAG: winged helix-turn-helix domain-containing protein [Candidatus Heimdallarchaeota archaeon]